MSNRDMERYRCFSRRTMIVGGIQAALLAALGTRLAWLQIVESEKYTTLSDQNRISLRLLPADRGQIVDRRGVPLAVNTQNFQVFLVAEQSPDVPRTLNRLSKLSPLNKTEIEKILADVKSKRRFTPVLVKENIDWETMARIEVNLPDLPGISTGEGKTRNYPLGEATAHCIGYVGLVSDTEVDENDPVTMLPGYRIGKSGMEKTHDRLLRGRAGAKEIEVNAVGREIREISQKPGEDGKRVTLTLDAELQIACQNRLARETSAAAVIMDVHTGAVYALCSYPSYDPNVFSRGISAALWEELLADPAAPLTNKVVSGQYPPGSTYKMVTAIAGLEAGVITAETSVFCPGHYILGNGKFHCWKPGGHGYVNVVTALEQSCDVFFYETARRADIDKISEVAQRLGLGKKLGVEIPGEKPGLTPTRDWKRSALGSKWHPGETIIAGIGQGYVLSTPLQLATMVSRLVNGGKAVTPFLTGKIEGEAANAPSAPALNFNSYHLDLVQRGMRAVTMGERGTARGAAIREPGYTMAGKTGTSQVRRITREERARGVKNETLPWKDRHHALFVGYGPVDNPKYACGVIVEHGVSGAGSAAPVARDILLEAQKLDPAAAVIAGDGAAETSGEKTP